MQKNKHLNVSKRKDIVAFLLAAFLLVLSFADHDDRKFIGKDFKSAAVEALEFDDIDFPTSVSRSSSQTYAQVQRNIILPLAIIFRLELFKELPSITFPTQLYGIHIPMLIVLELIVCSNAP